MNLAEAAYWEIATRQYTGPNQIELENCIADLENLLVLAELPLKREIEEKRRQIRRLLGPTNGKPERSPAKKKK